MKLDKIILILLISITLGACSNKRIDSTNMIVNNSTNMEKPTITRSHLGAVLGGATGAMACLEMLDAGPYVVASCTILGSFAGSNLLYDSDYDLHNAVFVDHLNTSGNGSSYTNWYNSKTGNSGIIKVTKSQLEGPIKCKDYDATIDIANQWPLIGIGGVNRKVVFGTACQTPDGKWFEKQ